MGRILKGIQVDNKGKAEVYTAVQVVGAAESHGSSEDDVRKSYQRAMDSMARLNRTASRLMHKYNAHAATDVTGFGLLGHAQALARNQKSEVGFVIHNLPIIAKMAAVGKACGNMFQLQQGNSAETSGGLLICLPR